MSEAPSAVPRVPDAGRPGGTSSAAADVIPIVEIAPLLDSDPRAWTFTDRALFAAAHDIGFVCLRGLPGDRALAPDRKALLLRIFGLDDAAKLRLYRRKFAPTNPNVYRGWFPLQPGNLTYKEGLDIGADVAHGPDICVPGDPLRAAS